MVRRGWFLGAICPAMVTSLSSSAFSGFRSPREMLNHWRKERLQQSAATIDPSRYHLQILFVDDDNQRARVAEGLLERIAEWADAGWWLYPHQCTIIGSTKTLKSTTQQTVDLCRELGLCNSRATAIGARLARSDLDDYGRTRTKKSLSSSSFLTSLGHTDCSRPQTL